MLRLKTFAGTNPAGDLVPISFSDLLELETLTKVKVHVSWLTEPDHSLTR